MIKLNDILKIQNIDNVKIRFNLMFGGNWNPIETFKNNETEALLGGHYSNYNKNKSFKQGQITVGLIRIKPNENLWLLFHIGKITKDLNKFSGNDGYEFSGNNAYEYETLLEYEKYFGRLIVRFKNTSQNMIRNASSVIEQCEVEQILPDIFDNDIFPGYDKVNISWKELSIVLEKDTWKTALQNQKGIYLITDVSNGKLYVGSAYGDEMILTRWRSYIKTAHGNNVELRSLDTNYIKDNFRFSILDIYKSTTSQEIIIERENWWKEIFLSRKFGYNRN